MVEFVGLVSTEPGAGPVPRQGPPLPSVADVLADADDRGYIRIDFSPKEREELAKLRKGNDRGSQIIARGYVEIDVNHLRKLPPSTPVRLGYETKYSFEEAKLLDS